MKKNYNYTRRKLFLPEYGRHIHEMIDSLMEIEDRRERNRQARAVIAVMGNLNPLLRDTADFTHKLWDHLFIMSDFQLDVDSPYPRPTRQDLTVTPRRMAYSQGRIAYKHYGKYVERMIRSLGEERNPQAVARTVDNLARYMRTKSYEYNQEHPNNEVIVRDIKRMSGGTIEIDENAINNLRSDYKQHFSFDLPFVLGLFVLSVFFILLLGVALLDDLFHQTSFEVAFFYLLGLASYCIFLYIFFTYLWVYLAYVGFIGYTLWCIRQLRKSHGYPYACGSCGAKMRSKGICPHCGALNE